MCNLSLSSITASGARCRMMKATLCLYNPVYPIFYTLFALHDIQLTVHVIVQDISFCFFYSLLSLQDSCSRGPCTVFRPSIWWSVTAICVTVIIRNENKKNGSKGLPPSVAFSRADEDHYRSIYDHSHVVIRTESLYSNVWAMKHGLIVRCVKRGIQWVKCKLENAFTPN